MSFLHMNKWGLRVSMTCLRSYNDRLRTHTHISLTLKLKPFPLQEDTRRLLSEAEVWWRRTRITTSGFTHRWRSAHCWRWFRDGLAFAKGYQASVPLWYFLATTRYMLSSIPSQSHFPGRKERLLRSVPSWFSRSLLELSREEAGRETI